MKKIILILILILSLGMSMAVKQEHLDYLNNLGVKIEKDILSKKQISRYEVVKYMNFAQCYDCMRPPIDIINKFNYGWFKKFKKQDKIYMNDISPEDDYYYCVVPLASLDYIHGYPDKNPVCGGEFCGSNNVQYSELLQIVVNVISPKIWGDYRINDMKVFYDNLQSIRGKTLQKSMNITEYDYQIAEKMKNKSSKSYSLENFNEFFLYQKYCNIFPGECNFKEFGNIKKGSYSLSIVNILYNEDLLSLREAINLDNTRSVSGNELIRWLYKIKRIKTCQIDNDYDKDGIENDKDNCMYTYNPSQKDTDGDGVGDVCDDDIDGDGIKNPIGIVDDKGNIVQDKVTDDMDNCLFVKNSNQKDVNNNGIGDACEDKGIDIIGIEIDCKPLRGNAPLHTRCTAKTEGDVKKIVRTYKGEVIGEGKNIKHTFMNDGKKIITATAIGKNNDTATANASFKVGKENNKNDDLDVGLQVSANPNSGPEGTRVVFTPKVRGKLDYIERQMHDGTKYKRNPKANFLRRFPKAGRYNIIARGYKGGKIAGISKHTINIYKRNEKDRKNKLSSYLQATPLLGYVNQNIAFEIKTTNINKDDISKVVWNFGDGTTDETNSINNDHKYRQRGTYYVQADIYLKNGIKIHNSITEKIIDKDQNSQYGATLQAKPLLQKIGKNIDFSIKIKGFSEDDISKVVWNFGDGTTDETKGLKNKHKYYRKGKKPVSATIILKNGDSVYTSLTAVIYGEDVCASKEAMSKLKCDMDKDGIPDMCDDDIDGDGVKNLLGLIKFEKADCSIDKDNIDMDRLKENQRISKKGGGLDNCPFNKNPDQIDSDGNGVGDICDDKTKDSDGDGIPDVDDACPFIPEDFNGIEDEDGCPELPNTSSELEIKVNNCNTCPCHYADYKSPFINGSKIKAILVNPFNTNSIYSESQSLFVR